MQVQATNGSAVMPQEPIDWSKFDYTPERRHNIINKKPGYTIALQHLFDFIYMCVWYHMHTISHHKDIPVIVLLV